MFISRKGGLQGFPCSDFIITPFFENVNSCVSNSFYISRIMKGGAAERSTFEIVLCRNAYEGSNPSLCASYQKGFRLFYGSPFFLPFLGCTIFSQVREKREFCRFLAFEIVHDMRIDFERKRGRRVSHKLLTYIHVDTAFATPCNKRVPQFVQVVRAA